MSEIIIPIPARLKNVAKNGHVAGAEDIIDNALNKEQSVINQETLNSLEGIDDRIDTIQQKIDDIGDSIQFDEDGDLVTEDGSDFSDDTARGKIPTIGAIVDGLNDGIYDVSKRNPTGGSNSDGKFTLDYILTNADTLIPVGWRHGGMTISFVHTSDNKYVQYRLMADEWSTSKADWVNIEKKVSQLEQEIQGWTEEIASLGTTAVTLQNPIAQGYAIAELQNVSEVIFTTEGGTLLTVNEDNLPYVSPGTIVSVKVESGSYSNIAIKVDCAYATKKDVDNSLNDFGFGNKLVVVGNNDYNVGNNGENLLTNVRGGEDYRIFIVNPDVDMAGVRTSSVSRFVVWIKKSDNTFQTLVNVAVGTDLQPYYDVTLPSDSVGLFISGRCSRGHILKTLICRKADLVSLVVPILVGEEIDNWDNGYYIPTLSVGQTINLSNKVASTDFQCAIVNCAAGDKFLVNNHFGGGTARAWAFIDSNNKVLSISDTGEILNAVATAPTNTAKVVFNNNKNGTGNWLKYYIAYDNQVNPNCLKNYATKAYVESAIAGVQNNVVDLIMFMGQSNMAGRGITNAEHTEGFPTIIDNAGFEFRAISDPTKLYPIVEPFGVSENKYGGINDGSMKTGSPVVAFVNAYYEQSGVSVIGVSASKGGTTISEWQPSGDLLPDAIQRLSDAVQFLTNNNYVIHHKYMVWLQGESDGDSSTTKETYTSAFNTMFAAMQTAGIEKCLLIRIGKRSYDEAYSAIIEAQTDLCKQNEDIVMISTALSDFRRLGYMKDYYHYYQDGYNRIGRIAGHNAGVFARYGIERMQFDSENVNNIYLSYKCN